MLEPAIPARIQALETKVAALELEKKRRRKLWLSVHRALGMITAAIKDWGSK